MNPDVWVLHGMKPHLYRCGSVWCCHIRNNDRDVFGYSITMIGAFMDAEMWCEVTA